MMPKRLSILRHAKSDWGDQGLADSDRPLNKRGREAADAVRRAIGERGLSFDLILSSPAVRTRETLERLGLSGQARWEQEIYLATAATLLRIIRGLPGEAGSALIVGHNPGLHELVLALMRPDAGALRDSVKAKLPTGALVALDFDCDKWDEVEPGSGSIAEVILPRELG